MASLERRWIAPRHRRDAREPSTLSCDLALSRIRVVRRGDGVRVAPGAVDATLANRRRSRGSVDGLAATGSHEDAIFIK